MTRAHTYMEEGYGRRDDRGAGQARSGRDRPRAHTDIAPRAHTETHTQHSDADGPAGRHRHWKRDTFDIASRYHITPAARGESARAASLDSGGLAGVRAARRLGDRPF